MSWACYALSSSMYRDKSRLTNQAPSSRGRLQLFCRLGQRICWSCTTKTISNHERVEPERQGTVAASCIGTMLAPRWKQRGDLGNVEKARGGNRCGASP